MCLPLHTETFNKEQIASSFMIRITGLYKMINIPATCASRFRYQEVQEVQEVQEIHELTKQCLIRKTHALSIPLISEINCYQFSYYLNTTQGHRKWEAGGGGNLRVLKPLPLKQIIYF